MSLEISSPQLSYGEYSPTRRSTAASSNAFASRASASVRVSTTERDLRAECFQLAKENERKDSKIETLTKEIQQLRNAITNQQVSSRSLLQVPTCRPSLFVVGSTLLPVRIFPFVMVTNARSLSFFLSSFLHSVIYVSLIRILNPTKPNDLLPNPKQQNLKNKSLNSIINSKHIKNPLN